VYESRRASSRSTSSMKPFSSKTSCSWLSSSITMLPYVRMSLSFSGLPALHQGKAATQHSTFSTFLFSGKTHGHKKKNKKKHK
jgi:hypothetical protein